MGRKGVSKRKPKTSKAVSNQIAGSSSVRQGDSSSVQSLMKDKSLPLSRTGVSSSAEKQKTK